MLDLENKIWFGYFEKKIKDRNFNDYLNTYRNKKPKCMVQYINLPLFMEISKDENCPYKFKLGEWVLTSGDCHTVEGVKIYSPFKDFDTAINYAKDNLGVNHFLEPPL